MTKQQEFRKQAEEAKFEAFSLMCKKVADLEKENKLLGERCNQLLKDKGDLTDRVSNQAESLRVTMLEEEKKGKRIEELEQQIEKMKFWHSKTEMEVVRDVLTEYMNNHESFDIAIFNVRNRLNGRLKNDRRRIL